MPRNTYNYETPDWVSHLLDNLAPADVAKLRSELDKPSVEVNAGVPSGDLAPPPTKEELKQQFPEKMKLGGVVPGTGNKDTVKAKVAGGGEARLTPGEYVVPKPVLADHPELYNFLEGLRHRSLGDMKEESTENHATGGLIGPIDIPPADMTPEVTTAPAPSAPTPSIQVTGSSPNTAAPASFSPSPAYYDDLRNFLGGSGGGFTDTNMVSMLNSHPALAQRLAANPQNTDSIMRQWASNHPQVVNQYAGMGQWGMQPGRWAAGLADWNRMQGTQGFRAAGEPLNVRQTRYGPVPIGTPTQVYRASTAPPVTPYFAPINRLMQPKTA